MTCTTDSSAWTRPPVLIETAQQALEAAGTQGVAGGTLCVPLP
jgi:hypothetical protein